MLVQMAILQVLVLTFVNLFFLPKRPSLCPSPRHSSRCLIIFLCDPRPAYISLVFSHPGCHDLPFLLLFFILTILRYWPRHDLCRS